MLKRVNTNEVRLGMFIHKLEGSWFKHPFWKARFLLEDEDMLDLLRDSAVPSVIIDTARGDDVQHVRVLETVTASVDEPIRTSARRASFGRARRSPVSGDRLPPASSLKAGGVSAAAEFGAARRAAGRAGHIVNRIFLESRLGKAVAASDVEPVIEDIYASIQRNLYAFNGLLRCQQERNYVYGHSLAVSALMIALARTMRLTPHDTREAGMAGLLMDIGVGQLPPEAAPDDGDYRRLPVELQEAHVITGHALLKAAGDIPEQVLRVCLRHHERLDGSGYPYGLAGHDLDVLSRMAAVCDCYDNLVTGHGSANGIDPADAINALQAMGPALDQQVLRHFIDTVGVYPIGSFVRLRSDRIAMVVDEAAADNAKPTVRIFHSLRQGGAVRQATLVLSQCYGEDDIAGTADPEALGLGDAGALREKLLVAAEREAS
ncbi:HD-GYP domain-containing protein [Novosphingobium huizhouense]|uniref:HD-GYP domain-containing protein n=1 Tax=Novosphingobium huizhouense TaxID=2866625 RepID=UPI001CD8EB04|nr:DUF3391 domain-containing protein [Novosphingobium huizhouense]